MRFFELLNYQHAIGSLLVPLIFLILFAVGLSFMPLVQSKKKQEKISIVHEFNDEIAEGDGPFPMIIALIIAGTICWALFYILYYGISEVKL